MRARILIPLFVLSLLAGCYVQPYNPPPTQVGQQPPPTQPAYGQQQPPPAAPEQPAYPPAQPAYPPPPPAAPPPVAYGQPVYEDLRVDLAGANVPSVDVFYAELAPYGTWYDDPKYGWVFAPPSQTYVPYSNG